MMDSFNLLEEKWIPVIHKSGAKSLIAPHEITQCDDPVMSLNTPRADFNGAMMEFLIGLLQTAIPPQDDEWGSLLVSPPAADYLQQQFHRLTDAFELRGEPARFMQDFDPIEGEAKPVSSLLIDAPGAKSVKDHTDHFIKHGVVDCLCPGCTAMALFTLQTYAPSGGVGHRTSLRGGGPLTTLVALDPKTHATDDSRLDASLWRNLWLNVLDKRQFELRYRQANHSQAADIFPWLAPTRSSEPKTGQDTLLEQVNPLQMYWGMPRRISLLWQDEAAQCDLCGQSSETVCRQFITRNYGVNYSGVWQHPLSPHYIDRKTGAAMPVHAQAEGLTYRHWADWVQSEENIRKAAAVVELFTEDNDRKLPQEVTRLHVFGFDMDNMKVRNWHQSLFPLYQIEDLTLRSEFNSYANKLIDAAMLVAGFTQTCIKEAWFKRPKDVRGDTAFIKDAFYQQTESGFYRALDLLLQVLPQQNEKPVLEDWFSTQKKTANSLFDYWAARSDVSVSDPRRIARAHQHLQTTLRSKKLLQTLEINLTKKEKTT